MAADISFMRPLLRFKAGFFDRPAVMSAVAPVERAYLREFGGKVRKTAKRSIKNAPKKLYKNSRGVLKSGRITSKPGNPPFNRVGLLKDHIFFAYEIMRRSVVIGPAKLGGFHGDDVPHKLERGGTVRTPRNETARLLPRPYMQPAFDVTVDRAPDLWRRVSAAA